MWLEPLPTSTQSRVLLQRVQWTSISSLNSFSKKKHPFNDVRVKTNDVFICLDSNIIDRVLLLWKTMKIKVWDFPLILERRWFKEGRSLNDQRSPLDQIKIGLEPSQITGPQFRLGKPFSLPGGCPPIALKRIFQILGSRWRLPSSKFNCYYCTILAGLCPTP